MEAEMTKRWSIRGAVLVALIGASVLAARAEDVTAARFEHLKALAGDWTAAGGDGSIVASYRVTAGGSAVIETLFPGSPHEMVTVFTVDSGTLVLTHYCAEGNQPHMKAQKGGDAGEIAFKFDGGGNMKSVKDGHMHEATFRFADADHFKAAWLYYTNGEPGETKGFSFVRVKKG
jgi:hypothetical protein